MGVGWDGVRKVSKFDTYFLKFALAQILWAAYTIRKSIRLYDVHHWRWLFLVVSV